jgi:hypothetical protein
MVDLRPTIPLTPEVIRRRHTVPAADDALFTGWGVRTLVCTLR